MSTDITPSDVVAFWKEAGPSKWFAKDEAFDARFRERFEAAHFLAARRQLDHWAETPEGSLALLILLDQFPRNVFRDTGHAFATDPLRQVELFQTRMERKPDDRWAEHHHGVIARFGRFPHRNRALGRKTTPEEQAFLDEDGFRG